MEEHEWELSKENVQPLRQGRTMSSLSKGLHADPKDEAVIRENQRAFELELRTYDGDDPLDVWYRYIKWTEQHFPKGRHDGQLPKLIEKCLKNFQAEGQYSNDPRFIKLWIEYSNFTDSPTDVFSYMFDNGIGTKVSQLYVEWATVLEIAGNTKRADSIYTEGINRMAEPKELLLQKQEQFQHRLAKNITLQIADRSKPEAMEDQEETKRGALTRLKPVGGGHRVGTTRTGAVSIGSAGRLKDQRGPAAPKQVPSQGFTVFNDENAIPHPPTQTNEWVSMPKKSVDSKENDRKPGMWTGAKLRQGRVATETPSGKDVFKIHEDPTGNEAVTPMKTTNMTHKPLSAVKAPQPNNDVLVGLRQGQGVPNLNSGIPMYPKDKIYNGVEEFSFEELRAIQYWKKLEKEARRRKEEAMKAQLEAQEKRLNFLENLLQSQLNGLSIQQQQQQSDAPDEMSNVQPMESESEPGSLQTSSSSLSTASVSSSFGRKSVSAKQDMFVKKMEAAASVAAPQQIINESTDFITPTNLSGAFPPKPPSSAKSQSSASSQRTPIFNSLSTYSSVGSSGGASLKGYGRPSSSGRLIDTSSSFNQSSTKSTPAKLTDEGNTSVCSGLTRNKVAITAPSPTVCTKEAFQLVQGMFCAELDPESLMEEGVETADLGHAPSSMPFQICEDKTEHNLPAQNARNEPMPVIYQDENNVQPLQIFQDENSVQQPMYQDENAVKSGMVYQDENNVPKSKAPFEFYQDENIPIGMSNRPVSSKKEGKKFGARLSFPAMEDIEMTDTDKVHLQDFTVAHAQEDVTIASLSTFSIKACAASTPFQGRSDLMPNVSQSVEREVSLPSCVNTTSQLMEDDSHMPLRDLSPILEGSGEGSSSSNNYTKSQVHSSLECGADTMKNSVHQGIAIQSVIHEDSDEGLADETHCDNQLLDATCHHIIDTSACLPNEETEALLAASVSIHTRDPFDKEAIRLYLSRMQPPLSSYKNYNAVNEDVQLVCPNDMICVGDQEMMVVDKCLGEGGYAQVFKMWKESFEDFDNFQAMKVQKPPCHWEFYVSCEIQKRLTDLKTPMNVKPAIMDIECGYFNETLSILVMKLLEKGSLLDLVNIYKTDPKLMGQVEPFVCLATIELLHLFEQLHKCDIIHGDVKPDNFLLMDLPVVSDSSNPHDVFGSHLRVFCLTDFGQTIDMHMFTNGTSFRTKTNTEGFECIEMRTDRPWTYQTDLFGLAGTVHVLLFGSYMKVFVERGVWKITGNFVRKWNVPLWKKFFHQLLNIPSCDSLPDLASLRAEFEEYFCSNLATYNEWARKVQILLARKTNLNNTKM